MAPTLINHIECTPGVRSGKPRIAGTRICVSDVVVWTEQGRSPDEIVTDFPQLTLADVYCALGYYHDHREEIDRQMRASEQFAESMRAEFPSKLPRNSQPRDSEVRGDSLSS
jgi:uncharacterized protein (DUF433 family)